MSKSALRKLRGPLAAILLAPLAGCAHQPLSPPEMEQLRWEFSKAILNNVSIDFPDSRDPEVEILGAAESSADQVRIHYRIRYAQDDEVNGQVLTSRTLDAQLLKLPEGGYKVVDHKTALQELEFDHGALIESKPVN